MELLYSTRKIFVFVVAYKVYAFSLRRLVAFTSVLHVAEEALPLHSLVPFVRE